MLLVCGTAGATATVADYWSLGENGSASATDSVGGKTLSSGVGTVAADSTTPTNGWSNTTSSLVFTAGGRYASGFTNLEGAAGSDTGWIAEISFNLPSVSGVQNIFTLGNGGGGQGSIVTVNGGSLYFGQQGVTYGYNAGSVLANTWYNIAWVVENGVGTFYVNRTIAGTSSTNYGWANNNGQRLIGTQAGGTNRLTGNLDNFRISTFAAGQFDASTDLLQFTAVPEPSTYGLIAAGASFATALIRRRKTAGK